MCRVRNCEILKVGPVSFLSRSHGLDVFKCFIKGAWQGGKAIQLHTSLVTNPSDINDFAIAYLVGN